MMWLSTIPIPAVLLVAAAPFRMSRSTGPDSDLFGSLLSEGDLPLTIYARAQAATGAWSEVVSFTVSAPPVAEKNLGRD